MTPSLPAFLLIALAASASQASAADPASLGGAVTANEPAAKARPVSSAVAELLHAAAPKYSPPSEAPSVPPPDVAAPHDGNAPRNGIIRLPRYLVEEPKIFLPNHRDVLTPEGRLTLALKRRPGLRFGNIWFLRNDGIALFMLEEEERLERLREIADLMSVLPSPLRKDAKATEEQLSLRPYEWITPAARRNR